MNPSTPSDLDQTVALSTQVERSSSPHELWHMVRYYYLSQGPLIFTAFSFGVLAIFCWKWTLDQTQRYRASKLS